MATNFIFKDSHVSGIATLYCRIQDSRPLMISQVTGELSKVNIRIATRLKVPVEKWQLKEGGKPHHEYFVRADGEGHGVYMKTQEIKERVNAILNSGGTISIPIVNGIITDVIDREAKEMERRMREEEARAKAEAERMTLIRYIDEYVRSIESGERTTNGRIYADSTIKAIRHNMKVIRGYVEMHGYDFDDITDDFYESFVLYLRKQCKYADGAVGTIVKDLKAMMHSAMRKKFHTNRDYEDFKATNKGVADSIFLTTDDIQKMLNVDLYDEKFAEDIHHNPQAAEKVRDIFMIGYCTGQRVSDYNNLKPENIQQITINDKTVSTITIVQQKTKARVAIPINDMLKSILEKYDNVPPTIKNIQEINDYIKCIGKIAGLDAPCEIRDTKGGKEHKKTYKKWELITTHTARRSFATNEYLSGKKDIIDIMRITGHTSVQQLRSYIKADELDVLKKCVKSS